MARIQGNSLFGPLFDGTDLLTIVAELTDLPEDRGLGRETKAADKLANHLILLDIARSLRKISEAPTLHSYYRSQYESKYPGGL